MKTKMYVYYVYFEYVLDGVTKNMGMINTADQRIDSEERFKELVESIKRALNTENYPFIKSLNFLHTKTMNENEYKCAVCGGVYEFGRSDEEAKEELNNNFPGSPVADCAIVCDDCYIGIDVGRIGEGDE
ncbi:MAG: hypothetical protein GY845_25810 [Planctomycetes bacterium]|nr:hypothetical protein [Planctomycetota bacterium]